MEIGFKDAFVSTDTFWKLYGPDVSGSYGGAQGIGGLEAVIRDMDGSVEWAVNDLHGNTAGWFNESSAVQWRAANVDAYGLPSNVTTRISGALTLQNTLWQGRRMDSTGLYWIGARYYDPFHRRFLTPDPLGHASDPTLYAYADFDPVNQIDPDGRFAAGAQVLNTIYNYAGAYNENARPLVHVGDTYASDPKTFTSNADGSYSGSRTFRGDSRVLPYRDGQGGLDSVFVPKNEEDYKMLGQAWRNASDALIAHGRSSAGEMLTRIGDSLSLAMHFRDLNTGYVPDNFSFGFDLMDDPAIREMSGALAEGYLTVTGTRALLQGVASLSKVGWRALGEIGGGQAVKSISPSSIRFSQSSVNGVEEIASSMRANGWQGAPIDVVRMRDGALTTFDNTRVLAASRAGIDTQAVIRSAGDAFPAGRWTTKSGITPTTWGEAIELRIQQQNRLFRQTYPNGSTITGSYQ